MSAIVINEVPHRTPVVEAPKPPRWMSHAHQSETTPEQVFTRLVREHQAAVGRIERLKASIEELTSRRATLMNSDGDAAKVAMELSTAASELELQEHRLSIATSERDGYWTAIKDPAHEYLAGLVRELEALCEIEHDKRTAEIGAFVTSWGVDLSKVDGLPRQIAANHPVVDRSWRVSQDARNAFNGTTTDAYLEGIKIVSRTLHELRPLITPEAAPAG